MKFSQKFYYFITKKKDRKYVLIQKKSNINRGLKRLCTDQNIWFINAVLYLINSKCTTISYVYSIVLQHYEYIICLRFYFFLAMHKYIIFKSSHKCVF